MALGDAEIAARNAAFLADPDAQRAAAEAGERWAAWAAAEAAAGPHAVVLPLAVALEVQSLLRGQQSLLFSRDYVQRMLDTRIDTVTAKGAL